MHRENLNVQESQLTTANRFEVLALMENFEKEDHKNVAHDISVRKLEGSRNKMGLILGELCHIKNASVDVSTSLEGNNNKTGEKLGDSIHQICDPDIEHSQQTILQSKGNKNGITAKLVLMPSHDNGNALKMTEETVKASSQHTQNKKVRTNNTLAIWFSLGFRPF